MYYPEEIIEDVRSNNDIVDIIGSYVHLTKKGGSYFGLCPFHNEKTPSFSVSKDKQIYHCFGCGEGGNVISFIMAYENFTFIEALRFLAKRANITLPEAEMTEEVKKAIRYKDRLYEANKMAARYFYALLRSKYGKNSFEYLIERQLSEETIKKFGLGYAMMYRDDMKKALNKKGFSDKELLDAGLLLKDKNNNENYYDRFFNRIMFPIFDVHSRVIAFGGRVVGEGMPKYLNSPETLLFDKSRNLYGLNIARKSKQDYFLIVEGYMDVIALHQSGFDNAIASLGTAFTGGQGNLIKRYVSEVIISYDSDGAGVNATLRAIPILESVGLSVRVLVYDEYKDPDEYIKNKGKEAYNNLIKKAMPSFMFEIYRLSRDYDLTDPAYKTEFSKKVALKLLRLESKLERDNYFDAIIKEYDISKEGLYELMKNEGNNVGIVANKKEINELRKKDILKPIATSAEKELVSILVTNKSIYGILVSYITPEIILDETLSKVMGYAFEFYKKGKTIEPNMILDKFTTVDEQKLIADIFSANMHIGSQEELEKLLNDTIKIVKNNYLDFQQKECTDPNKLMELIKQKKQLTNMYISLKDINGRD